MGQVASGVTAVAAGETLSKMFNATNVGATKAKVDALRVHFPGLLRRRLNNPPAPSRQRTLRFAAWLLTAELDFKNSPGDPSQGNFRDWLRWLTWLKKERPQAHRRIRNAIEDNLALNPPLTMLFTWAAASNDEDFSVTVKGPDKFPNDPHYEIEVLAKDGVRAPVTNDEDDTSPGQAPIDD